MGENGRSRIWWIVVVIAVVVILGGLGYYWYSRTGPEAEKILVAKEISPVDEKAASKGGPGTQDLARKPPETKDGSEKPEGKKTFPIDEEAASKKPAAGGTPPLKKEDVLKELRQATSDKMERLSELGKDEFVKIEKQLKPLFETGTAAPTGTGTTAPTGTGTDGQVRRLFEPERRALFGKASAAEIYCTLINEYIADFFDYLNSEKYIRRLDLKTDTYSKFKQILKRLTAQPPVPAGEGMRPAIMLTNIYYFSR
ncbi:MAG: hypothetical protein JRL30_14240, partial [Deltaproteobacteria bacterium]|nr:hypothetical protein [Deltaproteobacteria bacterium]